MAENKVKKLLTYLVVISLGITSIICIYLQVKENLSVDKMLSYDKYAPPENQYYSDFRQSIYLKKEAIWLINYSRWLSFLGVIISLILIKYFQFKKKWFWWVLIINLISINVFSDIIDLLSSCLILYLLYKFNDFGD